MAATPPWAAVVVTLVPPFWRAALGPHTGRVGRAFADGAARLDVVDLRDYGRGPHRRVDDTPFGGGAGMVLAAPPVVDALAAARDQAPAGAPVVAMTPRGRRLDQAMAEQLAAGPGVVLFCGRFEGVDERALSRVDLEVSVGDLVLSGGDPAALCLVDAAVRLLPGVLGNPDSLVDESFAGAGLAAPQYTRPRVFAGEAVPEVLLGGDHRAVAAWRRAAREALTRARRPDLVPASAAHAGAGARGP